MDRTFALRLTLLALGAALVGGTLTMAQPANSLLPARPQGPCDVYAAANTACAAAHSTTRALYASYNGPLYQVLRKSDGRTLNISVVRPSAGDPGGYANAAAQDAFCAGTVCWISIIYDQSPKQNHLYQAPRGAFLGQGMGGYNNLPLADAAPVTLMGHKVYGIYIVPGMGMRLNDPKGTAVDDQAQGQYWVLDGQHYNSGCCFNYGNAELTSRDDGNGTMESTHFGNSTSWFHGQPPGPWIMSDQENNLVGCANPGSDSKFCANLPSISWRFVTATIKGKPGSWASMGGDAQRGNLRVLFDGPRVDVTYDPMRKQGAILLGNGGDNSIASQGTFYEGAMTAATTYPSHDTDQLIQANVVAAGYDVPMLAVAPALAIAQPTGLQSFQPGTVQETAIRFTNTTGVAITNLRLSLSVPAGWTATSVSGANITGPLAPGASVNAVFRVASGPAAFDGEMTAAANWQGGRVRSWKAVQKLRNAAPVKINEFRIGDAANASNSFIELYNAGGAAVDISGWALTQHGVWQTVASAIRVPANTKLEPRSFYLLGLSNSGLAVPARAGDSTIHVRSVEGLKEGDTINIGGESRRITRLGTAAGPETNIWQPMPEGRSTLTVAKGASSVPVYSVAGFKAGEKIALGYGATYPATYRETERFEIATVTSIGKPGSYPYLATEAHAGATNISVTNTADISVGDRIRLDVDSVGHGIDIVTVKTVGTPAILLALNADAAAGATSVQLRIGTAVFNNAAANAGPGLAGLAVGQKLVVGNPGKLETVTITSVNGSSVGVTPALRLAHVAQEAVVGPGTGLELTAPLKFTHSGNLPFSNRGTGISFTPASRFVRSTNEPVIPLGTGITLDRPLAQAHEINAVVRAEGVRNAGYQGPLPQQWFGGPALSAAGGTMILRDGKARVVDSLNYGLIVEPWAAEGYQGVSGTGQAGCRAPAAGGRGGRGAILTTNSSAGRVTDGRDTDSNCNDFVAQPATLLPEGAAAGATNIKVAGVSDFAPGQSVTINSGANMETAIIAQVGTQGAATSGTAVAAGETVIPLGANQAGGAQSGFIAGQAVVIDAGANRETATVAAVQGGRGGARMTVTAPLRFAHPAGVPVAGTGFTLAAPLGKAHAAGTQIITDLPTPGAPNRYPPRR